MSRLKTTRGPAKAGGMYLILNKLAILMRHKKYDFKILMWPRTLLFSLVKQERRVEKFAITNDPKEIKFPLQKIKEPPI